MATYRQVHTSFWQDSFVLELTPEEKYFYLYLLTNSKTTQCGIYELPKKVIELETGYNRDTVEKLINRFIDYGKIDYCNETREIMILNWFKYNLIKSMKVTACINKELKQVKNKAFLKKLYSMDTVSEIKNTLSIDLGEEKEQEKEQEEEQQQEEKKMSVYDFYQQNFGVLNSYIGESISKWVNDLNVEMVIEAMKRALAQQKKWNYAEGILKNWANQNIRSLEAVQALDKEFERRGNKPKRRSLFEQGEESRKRQAEAEANLEQLTLEELEELPF